MKIINIIDNYEDACEEVAEKINNLYFDGETDIDWVGGEIGGVAIMADYFFDIDFMLTALKYEATEKQFFEYYSLQLEEKTETNFKNFIKYYKGLCNK